MSKKEQGVMEDERTCETCGKFDGLFCANELVCRDTENSMWEKKDEDLSEAEQLLKQLANQRWIGSTSGLVATATIGCDLYKRLAKFK